MLNSMVPVELCHVPWGLGALEDQVVAAAISTTVQYVKGEAGRLGPPSSWRKSVKSQFLRKVGRMGEQAPQKRIMAFEKIHNLVALSGIWREIWGRLKSYPVATFLKEAQTNLWGEQPLSGRGKTFLERATQHEAFATCCAWLPTGLLPLREPHHPQAPTPMSVLP